MDTQHLERLSKAEERGKSNTHRIEDLERRQADLDKIAGAVQALAIREENVESTVKEIKSDVKSLTGRSGQRWESLVDKVIWAVCAAVIAFVLAKIGLA